MAAPSARKSLTLSQAVKQGQFLLRGTPFSLHVSQDFLSSLAAVVPPNDERGAGAWYEVGEEWATRWLERLETYAQDYGATLMDVELEDLLRLLEDELGRSGWGRVQFDTQTYAGAGLFLATVNDAPLTVLEGAVADAMALVLSGFVAGALGRIADLPLSGMAWLERNEERPLARVLVGMENQLTRIQALLEDGMSWRDALARAG